MSDNEKSEGLNNTTSIWDFFERSTDRRASCKVCDALLSYRSTTANLRSHLKRRHGYASENFHAKIEKRKTVTRTIPISSKILPRKNFSIIWSMFTKSGANDGMADCNLCGKTYSYRTTIGNLRKHLESSHKDNEFVEGIINNEVEYLEFEDEDDTSKLNGPLDNVSDYFSSETEGHSKCIVCQQEVEAEEREMRRHLEKAHPKLITESDQESEKDALDNTEPEYTEVIYLNEKDQSDEEVKRREVRKRRIKRKESVKRRRTSCSSSEVVAQYKNEKPALQPPDDGLIEEFGKYLVCLLKTVPSDACTKLQMDIINMVMTAKLEGEKTKSVTSKSTVVYNNAPLTIQTVGSSLKIGENQGGGNSNYKIVTVDDNKEGGNPSYKIIVATDDKRENEPSISVISQEQEVTVETTE